jgi:hypothetical protein
MNNYGVECIFELEEIKEKIKKNNLEKFGVEYFSIDPIERLNYLEELINNNLLFDIKDILKNIKINEQWMNSPNKRKLEWLKKNQKQN